MQNSYGTGMTRSLSSSSASLVVRPVPALNVLLVLIIDVAAGIET